MKKILIIIPAYNEEENIRNVITSVLENELKPDIIVINDCSTDRTKRILMEEGIPYIDLPVNLGIGGGVQTGYQYANEHGYDIAVQFDGDGQHDIKYLKDLVAPIISGDADYVIGSRYLNKEGFQSTLLRRIGIKFLSYLIKICTGTNIKDVTSGYRAINRTYIEIFSREYAQDYPEPEAIVLASCLGARIREVPVVMRERLGGESSISGFKSVYYMLKVSLAIIFLRIVQRSRR